jgi:hypothetical protein
MKTVSFTSGEWFKVCLVKISVRSDKVKGGGGMLGTIERSQRKTDFEKNAKQVLKLYFLTKKFRKSVSDFLWTFFNAEFDGGINKRLT